MQIWLVVEPPIWKICSSNWKFSPNRGENKKYLKPPARNWNIDGDHVCIYKHILPRKLHPWNLTWNLKRSPWKRWFLLETIIFRFHVKFRGSIGWNLKITPKLKGNSSSFQPPCWRSKMWSFRGVQKHIIKILFSILNIMRLQDLHRFIGWDHICMDKNHGQKLQTWTSV